MALWWNDTSAGCTGLYWFIFWTSVEVMTQHKTAKNCPKKLTVQMSFLHKLSATCAQRLEFLTWLPWRLHTSTLFCFYAERPSSPSSGSSWWSGCWSMHGFLGVFNNSYVSFGRVVNIWRCLWVPLSPHVSSGDVFGAPLQVNTEVLNSLKLGVKKD